MANGQHFHTTDTVPSIRVEFPLAPGFNNLTVTSVEWIQEQNKHDLMVVEHLGTSPDTLIPYLPAGSPIKVVIRTPRGKKTFFGYIHKAEPIYDSFARKTRITAVSAGYPLKEQGKMALSDVTADMAVKKIARKHRLFADVEPHPRKFRQLVQSGESDWEFLTRIADEVGYSVRIEGATLRFVSRAALSRHYRTLSPTLAYSKNRGSYIYDVLSFTPVEGAYLTEMSAVKAKRQVDYLDKYAKSIASARTSTPTDTGRLGRTPQYTMYDRRTARSFREAEYIAQARMDKARYGIIAEAEIVGNPIIAPDVSVFLKGVPRKFSGYWTVLKAHHRILPTQYTIEMTLGSEGDGKERHGPKAGPGSRHRSKYRLRTPYPTPQLTTKGAKIGKRAIQIPDFFDKGPRWESRRT